MRLILALLCIGLVSANLALDNKRVHIFDAVPRKQGTGMNFMVRGNMPLNQTAFAYDQLSQIMAQRAKEMNLTWSPNFYLVDIALNNDLDGSDLKMERDFWAKAPKTLGEFINWPLGLAGLLPPNFYPEPERRKMANGSVWEIDKIPDRVQIVHDMLVAGRADKQLVIYVHCSAGCDRTGEFVGSYRMQFTTPNAIKMYNLNCAECGRAPNYFGTTGLEWYCYYYEYRYEKDIGDCMGFAECKMFGDCKPLHPNGTSLGMPARKASLPSPLFELPAELVLASERAE
jgi:hypothetical protein